MLNGTRVLANGRANGDRRDEGDEEGLAPRYASIIHFTSASVQAWASRKKQAGNPARRNEHVCCKLVPPAASTWMGQAVRQLVVVLLLRARKRCSAVRGVVIAAPSEVLVVAHVFSWVGHAPGPAGQLPAHPCSAPSTPSKPVGLLSLRWEMLRDVADGVRHRLHPAGCRMSASARERADERAIQEDGRLGLFSGGQRSTARRSRQQLPISEPWRILP